MLSARSILILYQVIPLVVIATQPGGVVIWELLRPAQGFKGKRKRHLHTHTLTDTDRQTDEAKL